MRFLYAAAILVLTSAAVSAQSTDSSSSSSSKPKPPKAPTSLPTPKAEPENPNLYAPPVRPAPEGPTEADVGPVQKHFVRASTLDAEPVNDDLYDNHALATHTEKQALDKRISVSLIHDVQND